LILVQAGIELAREVLSSPITRRLIVTALCKITSGSFCRDSAEMHKFFTKDGKWRTRGGKEPNLIITASDEDGDETTVTCGVSAVSALAWSYKTNEMDTLMAEVKGYIPPDYAGLITHLNRDSGDGDGAYGSVSVPWISWDDFRLETLDSFEQFIEKELFKTAEH